MSNTVRQFLPIVGGLVGGAIGGPVGWAVGTLIGGYLGRPKTKPTDLDQTRIPKTGEGVMLPLLFGGIIDDEEGKGGCPSAGVFIDCSPDGGITTSRKKVRTGKLQPKQEVTEMRMTAAIAFGDAICGPLICDELWYGDLTSGKRIFYRYGTDTTYGTAVIGGTVVETTNKIPGTKGDYDLEQVVVGDEAIGETCDNLEIWYGTWKQPPSPILEALHGAGNVPAYRGQAYIVVKDFVIDSQQYFTGIWRNNITGARIIVKTLLTLPDPVTLTPLIDPASVCLCHIDGELRGAFQTDFGPPRDLAEQIARWSHCDLHESDGMIRDSDRRDPAITEIARAELATRYTDEGEEIPTSVTLTETPDQDIPSEVHVGFLNMNKNWEQDYGIGSWKGSSTYNVQQMDFGIVAIQSEAATRAQIYQDEAVTRKIQAEFATPYGRIRHTPGEVLTVPIDDDGNTLDIYIEKQTIKGYLTHTGHRHLTGIYGNHVDVGDADNNRPEPETEVYTLGALWLADTVNLSDDTLSQAGFLAAACGVRGGRYKGASLNFTGEGYRGAVALAEVQILEATPIGTLQADFDLCSRTVFDYSTSLHIKMIDGQLSSAPGLTITSKETATRNGANLLMVGTRAIRFVLATPVPDTTDEWELTGLMEVYGTEDLAATTATGTVCALAQDSSGIACDLYFVPVDQLQVGYSMEMNVAAIGRNGSLSDDFDFLVAGNNLKCLSPAQLNAVPPVAERDSGTDVVASWKPRTRYISTNSSWTTGGVRVSDPTLFDLELYDGVTLVHTITDIAAETVTLAAADLAAWYGSYPASGIAYKVYQKNELMGRGFAGEYTEV